MTTGPHCLAISLACLLAASLSAAARMVHVTLLHTSDLHGRIAGQRHQDDARPDRDGLLRVATYIDEVRRLQENVMVVDSGNALAHSTANHLYDGALTVGLMDELQYDMYVPGVRDLAAGPERLRDLFAETSIPLVAANFHPGTKEPDATAWCERFRVMDVDGVRIVLVGLTAEQTALELPPRALGEAHVEEHASALAPLLPSIRALQPDILVAVVHDDFYSVDGAATEMLRGFVREYPDFDLIVGGKTGQAVAGYTIGGVLYTQAGRDGRYVGRVDFSFDTVVDSLVRKSSELIEVGTRFVPDSDLRERFASEVDELAAYNARVVGVSRDEFSPWGKEYALSPLEELAGQALLEGAGADVALFDLSLGETLFPGVVTVRDVWRVVPECDAVGVAMLTPGEIAGMLEASVPRDAPRPAIACIGLHYDMAFDEQGRTEISNIRLPDGPAVHGRKRLRVALSSALISSGLYPGVRRLIERPRVRFELLPDGPRSMFEAFIRKHSPLRMYGPESRSPLSIVRGEDDGHQP